LINWPVIKSKLPFIGHAIDPNRLPVFWNKIDIYGKGLVTLSEIEDSFKNIGNVMDPILHASQVLWLAFNLALSYSTDKNEHITKKEFKYFLIYLNHFYEISLFLSTYFPQI
jgi:hypothetical protein